MYEVEMINLKNNKRFTRNFDYDFERMKAFIVRSCFSKSIRIVAISGFTSEYEMNYFTNLRDVLSSKNKKGYNIK